MSAALVLGGVDFRGPHLFTVYPHGSTDSLPFATMGSGSLNAMAVFEAGYKDDLSKEDALALVARAIRQAPGSWRAAWQGAGGACHACRLPGAAGQRPRPGRLPCSSRAGPRGAGSFGRSSRGGVHAVELAPELSPGPLTLNILCRSGVMNDLGSGSNVDLCVITKEGVEYLRNHEYLQGKTFQRQFPQRFAAGSAREPGRCCAVLLPPATLLACAAPLQHGLWVPPPVPRPPASAAAGHSHVWPSLNLLSRAPAVTPAAVVRERVYDIKKVVTVVGGEPEEMEVS